jgi:putative MATE family efflux protein
MQSNKSFLGKEKISKLLWKQSLPAILGMIMMSLYNLVDTIFIGQSVGTLGIAGLAISFPIQMILMAMAFLLGIGSASIISRAIGAKNKKKAENVLGNFFSLSFLISIIITFVGYFFLKEILILFGASATILPYAQDYMKIIVLGTIFVTFAAGSNNIIRSQGDAKYAMLVVGIPAIMNIILDAIFIFVLGWGIKGAALATVIGQITSSVLAFIYFTKKTNYLKIKLKNFILKLSIVKEIFSVGSSSLSRNASASLMAVIVNNSLNFYGGDLAVASYGILAKIMMFMMMPMFGIIHGLQPILGYNYGAKKYERAKESIIEAIKKTTIYCIIVFILLFVFTEKLVSIFTNDIELIKMSVIFIRIVFILLPTIGFQVISSGIYQTMGKAKMAFFISILRQTIIIIPLIIIFPLFFGLIGIFIAYPVSDFISSIITWFLLKYEFKLLDSHKIKIKEVPIA